MDYFDYREKISSDWILKNLKNAFAYFRIHLLRVLRGLHKVDADQLGWIHSYKVTVSLWNSNVNPYNTTKMQTWFNI